VNTPVDNIHPIFRNIFLTTAQIRAKQTTLIEQRIQNSAMEGIGLLEALRDHPRDNLWEFSQALREVIGRIEACASVLDPAPETGEMERETERAAEREQRNLRREP
jgi:hypothetical protein